MVHVRLVFSASLSEVANGGRSSWAANVSWGRRQIGRNSDADDASRAGGKRGVSRSDANSKDGGGIDEDGAAAAGKKHHRQRVEEKARNEEENGRWRRTFYRRFQQRRVDEQKDKIDIYDATQTQS